MRDGAMCVWSGKATANELNGPSYGRESRLSREMITTSEAKVLCNICLDCFQSR